MTVASPPQSRRPSRGEPMVYAGFALVVAGLLAIVDTRGQGDAIVNSPHQ
ncbi:MAG: hypothetical protein ACRDS0_26410 [Pseudonocardiaceae bacterium]